LRKRESLQTLDSNSVLVTAFRKQYTIMKRILVPTDFSPIADNALKYAIEIAAKFKSELYLYHVYSFDKFNYDINFHKDEQPFTAKVNRSMKKTRQKFMEKIRQNGLFVQTYVEQDNFFSLFGKKVKKHEIDLIVMGSKGASGLKKVIFGSVAATALDTAKVPVLVVPPNCSFHPPKHIVLTRDDSEVSSNVLSPLLKLAVKFGARLTLLKVNTGSNKYTYRETDLDLDGVETTYREVPMSNSINESINGFIERAGCDLLCMIRREKSFFESIFNNSITKNQAFSSQVPLLVLPENGESFGD
jgi:nucleotide-binding universal stress UspA family protein